MNTKGIGAKLTIRNIAITLVIAAAYYYAKLPALNFQNKAFYSFIFVIVAVYCVLTALSMGGLKSMNDPREVWRGLKKVCAVPLIICGSAYRLRDCRRGHFQPADPGRCVHQADYD